MTSRTAPLDDQSVADATARRRRRHRIAIAVGWAAAVIAYQVWAVRSGLGPKESVTRLVDFLQGSSWGPVVLGAIYVLRPLVLFSAAVLTVAAGFLFGAVLGLALVILVSNASAMLAYAIGRWFGAGGATIESGRERVGRYLERMRTRGFETTLIMRLVFLPYDLVSYAAGLSRIHPGAFLAATAIGSIPGTVVFVLFGASIEDFDGAVPSLDFRLVGLSLGLLVVSLMLARVVRRREGSRDERTA